MNSPDETPEPGARQQQQKLSHYSVSTELSEQTIWNAPTICIIQHVTVMSSLCALLFFSVNLQNCSKSNEKDHLTCFTDMYFPAKTYSKLNMTATLTDCRRNTTSWTPALLPLNHTLPVGCLGAQQEEYSGDFIGFPVRPAGAANNKMFRQPIKIWGKKIHKIIQSMVGLFRFKKHL